MIKRRDFLQALGASSAGWAWPAQAGQADAGGTEDPWARAQELVDRLRQPLTFRQQDFVVTQYGAKPCPLVPVQALVSHTDRAVLSTPAPGAPDCYAAFATAMAACQQAGGGRVVIPAGNWFCAGPLVLKSLVHVHLEAGAHIYFSHQPADYARYGSYACGAAGTLELTRWQGNDCLNFSSPVYAIGQSHFALTGADWTSILDGQGGVPFGAGEECWWSWKQKARTVGPDVAAFAALTPHLSAQERAFILGHTSRWLGDESLLPALSEAGVPAAQRIFGLGHLLRPSMIHLLHCKNVLLQGYQVTNTPFWQHHPVDCQNLVLRKVHANSLGPNSDGFDPEACDGVLVEDCLFDTGDDCIAIKAGKNKDTQHGPSQNIVIQNCVMQSGHGAITLGSEMAGGIRHVFAQDILMQNAHWQTNPLNTAIRFKTNMNRGGYLTDLHVRRVQLPNGVQTTPSYYPPLPGSPIPAKTVATAAGAVVTIDCDYAAPNDSVRTRPPRVARVSISDVVVGNVSTPGGKASCYQAVLVLGPVAYDYNGPAELAQVLPVSDIRISHCDFGTPANAEHPVYSYNVTGLRLENVKIADRLINTVIST